MSTTNKTPKPCPQDCRKCGFQQHAYCAAQMAFGLSVQMEELAEKVARIDEIIASLGEVGTVLSVPMGDEEAQKGSGAEVDSQDKN